MSITLSMSGMLDFLRCDKKFELKWIKGIMDDKEPSEAQETGTSIHRLFESYLTGEPKDLDWDSDEGKIVKEYLKHHPITEKPISIEQTLTYKLSDEIFLTFTPDLITGDKKILTVVDWKTFSKMPSFDTDLDFQVVFYLAFISMLFAHYDLFQFEHRYIRTTLPNIPKDKAGNKWSPEECYVTQRTMLSREELADARTEISETAHEILRKSKVNTKWRRRPQKGFDFNSCGQCPTKGLCSQDYEKQPNFVNLIPHNRGTIWEPTRES